MAVTTSTITHVGTNTASNFSGSNNSPTLTVDVPAGTQDGDALILCVYNSAAASTPSGTWTKLDDITGLSGKMSTQVYYRYASSEPASYDVTRSSGNSWGVAISSFRNVNSTTIVDTYAADYWYTTNPTTTPSVTPNSGAGTYVLTFHASRSSDTNIVHHSASDTELADWGEHNGTNGRTGALYFSGQKGAGSVSGLSVSMTGSLANSIQWGVLLKPAVTDTEGYSDTCGLGDDFTFTLTHAVTDDLALDDAATHSVVGAIEQPAGDVETLNDGTPAIEGDWVLNVFDKVRLSDANFRSTSMHWSEIVSDTEALDDSLERTFMRPGSDDLSLNDSASLVRMLVFSDSNNLSDSTTYDRSITTVDDASPSDTVSRTVLRPLSDAASPDDTVDHAADYTRTVADDVELLDDAILPSRGEGEVHADDETLDDSVQFIRTIVVSDSVGLGDSQSYNSSYAKSDSVNLNDSASVTLLELGIVHPVDFAGLSDSLATYGDFVRSRTDDVRLGDFTDITLLGQGFQDESDHLGLSDTVSHTADFTRSQTDTESLVDQANVTLLGKGFQNQTDPLGLSDAVSFSLTQAHSDTEDVSDQAATAVQFVSSTSDIAGLSDATATDRSLSLDDEVTLEDQEMTNGDQVRAFSDTVRLGDGITRVGTKPTLDVLSTSDEVSLTLTQVHADGVELGEAIGYTLSRDVADSVALDDAHGHTADYQLSLSDTEKLVDMARTLMNGAKNDEVIVGDSVSFERTWHPVDAFGLSDTVHLTNNRPAADEQSLSDAWTRELARELAGYVGLDSEVSFDQAKENVDTLRLGDDVSLRLVRPATDTEGLDDSWTRTLTSDKEDNLGLDDSTSFERNQVESDSLSLTDDVTRTVTRHVSETLPLTDSHGTVLIRDLVDNAGLSDELLPTSVQPYVDDVDLSDDTALEITMVVNDAMTISSRHDRTFARELDDTLSTSDELYRTEIKDLTDDASPSDDVSLTWDLVVVEVVDLDDQYSYHLTGLFGNNYQDRIRLNDELLFDRVLVVSDALGLDDSESAAFDGNRNYTLPADNLSLSDSCTRTVLRTREISLKWRSDTPELKWTAHSPELKWSAELCTE